jgi:hypothetical protein
VQLERISLLALLPKYRSTNAEEARENDRAKARPTSMPLAQVLLSLPLSLHACVVQKYKY